MHHTSCSDTEIQFGRDDSPSETIVTAFGDTGQVTITVQNTEVRSHVCDNELTLGQTIQLRDFLNRHIDGLALAATGSLAVRSSDDPAQLAGEEQILHTFGGVANFGRAPEADTKWPAVKVEGCGKPLASHKGYARHCGSYVEERSAFPLLCKACSGL